MDVNAIIRDQGPRDPTLLHLQETHRSRAVWRAGGAPLQTFRRRDANQSDMNMDVRLIPIIQAAGVYGLARDQLQGPHGVRWLVGHSYLECDGRTVGTARMALDGLAPVPEYMDWYLPRTVRFVSHLGALLIGLGVSLQALADGTRHLPDMHQIATQSLQAIRDRHAYVFHQLLVEEHEAVHDEDEEDARDRGGRAGGERGRGGGRRGRGAGRGARGAGRGGRASGRGGRAHGRGGRGGGRLVDEPIDDADHADEQDHVDTGEDGGPESSTAAAATAGESSAAAAATATATPPVDAAAATATTTGAGDWWPSFSLGLSLPSQPIPEQQTSQMPDTSTEHPPPVVQRQHRIRPWHGTPEVPPFDLGSSSQSTQSTQPSQPGTQPSVPPFDFFYVRRSKKERKAPDCGTGSHRG
ncbi:hypothetical protein ACET3Z_000607 [Daucus carota]